MPCVNVRRGQTCGMRTENNEDMCANLQRAGIAANANHSKRCSLCNEEFDNSFNSSVSMVYLIDLSKFVCHTRFAFMCSASNVRLLWPTKTPRFTTMTWSGKRTRKIMMNGQKAPLYHFTTKGPAFLPLVENQGKRNKSDAMTPIKIWWIGNRHSFSFICNNFPYLSYSLATTKKKKRVPPSQPQW